MANQLNVEEIMERAKRAQEARLTAIQRVVEARQALVDERSTTDKELAKVQESNAKRLATAEQNDERAYSASISAGWTPDELKKIGFSEPEKMARTRRRRTRKGSPRTTATKPAAPSQEAATPVGGEATEVSENHS